MAAAVQYGGDGAAQRRRMVLAMQRSLRRQGCSTVFVPVIAGTKQPTRKHKGGAYTEADFRRAIDADDGCDWGLLCEDLVVLDFDVLEDYGVFEQMFPEVQHVPMETTRRGAHVFFKRCARLDAAAVTDRTNALIDASGRQWKTDLKTVTASFIKGVPTRGLVVVAPSAPREWVRPLTTTPLKPMSDRLVTWVIACYRRAKAAAGGAKGPGGRAAAPAAAKKSRRPGALLGEEQELAAAEPERVWEPATPWDQGGVAKRREDGTLRLRGIAEADFADVRAMVLSDGEFGERREWQKGESEGFSFLFTGRCPLCNRPERHHNSFYVKHTPAGGRYLCTLSPSCARADDPAPLKLSAAGAAAYTARLELALAAAGATRASTTALLDYLQARRSCKADLAAAGDDAWVDGGVVYCRVATARGEQQWLVLVPMAVGVADDGGSNEATSGRLLLTRTPWDLNVPSDERIVSMSSMRHIRQVLLAKTE